MANKIPVNKFIENIKIKTGKSPGDFRRIAITKRFFEEGKLKPSIKASDQIK